MSPTIFSKEEIGEDKIEKLIKAAFEGYENLRFNTESNLPGDTSKKRRPH
jgi:hypothetical protein